MEPINNSQPAVATKDLSSIAGRAFASFNGEMAELLAMTKSENLPVANLGTQVDIKV